MNTSNNWNQKPWNINPYEPHINPHDKYKKYMESKPPKPVTIADLFPRLDRLTIGWSPVLETLKTITNNKPSYPPYDIVELEDGDVNLLNVAVAGFTKDELTITLHWDSTLIIQGKQKEKQRGDVLYQGIATRDFTLELSVAEHWYITNAKLDNGMLTIQFNKEFPEELKPKVIDIK